LTRRTVSLQTCVRAHRQWFWVHDRGNRAAADEACRCDRAAYKAAPRNSSYGVPLNPPPHPPAVAWPSVFIRRRRHFSARQLIRTIDRKRRIATKGLERSEGVPADRSRATSSNLSIA
jgi:hypothetical protein